MCCNRTDQLSHLLGLSEKKSEPYDHVLVLQSGYALLIDTVKEILRGREVEPMAIPSELSFNDCVESCFRWRGETVCVLSEQKLLLVEERRRMEEFKKQHDLRLSELEAETCES